MGSAKSGNLRFLTFGVLIGSIIEQYDFLVTGTVAALIWPQVFFPKGQSLATAIFTSVGVYGLGLIIRPVGAYVWGQVADRSGRKRAMIWALVVMGIGTLAVGLTPGYATIGESGLIMLAIFRLIQGFSFGGEFGTAATWLVEGAAKTNRRGFWGSWVGQSVPVGIISGSGSVALIMAVLPTGDLLSYGWRILFVAGFLAAVTGIIIRLRLEESPLFKEVAGRHEKLDSPASKVWREKPGLILHLSLLNAGLGAAFWLSQVFGVSYMYLTGIPAGQASLTNVYAALVAMVLMYIGGTLADRYGRKVVIFTGLLFMVALAYPYVLAIGSGNYATVVLAQVVFFSLTYGLAYPAQPAFYAEHFATSYRASGVNNAYQMSQVYGGGLAPILATYVVSVVGGAKLASPYLVVMIALYGIIAIAGILTFKETKAVDLTTIPA